MKKTSVICLLIWSLVPANSQARYTLEDHERYLKMTSQRTNQKPIENTQEVINLPPPTHEESQPSIALDDLRLLEALDQNIQEAEKDITYLLERFDNDFDAAALAVKLSKESYREDENTRQVNEEQRKTEIDALQDNLWLLDAQINSLSENLLPYRQLYRQAIEGFTLSIGMPTDERARALSVLKHAHQEKRAREQELADLEQQKLAISTRFKDLEQDM